jgi:hypothetical protein
MNEVISGVIAAATTGSAIFISHIFTVGIRFCIDEIDTRPLPKKYFRQEASYGIAQAFFTAGLAASIMGCIVGFIFGFDADLFGSGFSLWAAGVTVAFSSWVSLLVIEAIHL